MKHGGGTLPAGEDLSFFVQAVDMAGNVAVGNNNGLYYGPCVMCRETEVYLPMVLNR